MAEAALRLAFPYSRLLDVYDAPFWVQRFREEAREKRRRRSPKERHDPLLGWRLVASYRSKQGDESTNSAAMRGRREYAVEKPDGVLRVLVVGDSMTYGYAVADDETYAARMEELLPGAEVLNFGVNGYGTDQQFLHWREDGRKYRPDVVLLGFHIDDFHRNVVFVREHAKPRFVDDGDGFRLAGVPVPTDGVLLRSLSPVPAWRPRLLDAATLAWRKLRGREADRTFDEKARVVAHILRVFKASTDETGARLCLVLIPDAARIEEALARACAENDVPMLDLLRAFSESEVKDDLARFYRIEFDDHIHWTPAGHRLGAELIVDFLRREGLVD